MSVHGEGMELDELERLPPGRTRARAAATFATNIAVAVLSLANVLLVAGALGPVGRGEVAFLTTVAFLVSSLATFGLHEANANIAARESGRRASLATNSAVFAGGAGLLAALLVLGLQAVVPAAAAGVPLDLRLLALASLPVLILAPFLEYLIQADYGYAVTNAGWLAPVVVTLALNGSLFAAGELTAGRAFAAWVGGQLLGTLLLAIWIAARGAGFGRPDLGLLRRSLRFGLRAHLGRVVTLGNYRLDQWLLGALAGTRELGVYSLAVAWSETLFFLPTVLARVLRPDLVRSDQARAARLTALAFRVALTLTALAAIVLAVAAPVLCVVLFSESFAGAVDDLRILAVGGLGMVALKIFGAALTARGRPLAASFGAVVAFVTVVALDIALIPSFGGTGAALASTVAYVTGGLAALVAFNRLLGGPWRELLPRPSELASLAQRLRR